MLLRSTEKSYDDLQCCPALPGGIGFNTTLGTTQNRNTVWERFGTMKYTTAILLASQLGMASYAYAETTGVGNFINTQDKFEISINHMGSAAQWLDYLNPSSKGNDEVSNVGPRIAFHAGIKADGDHHFEERVNGESNWKPDSALVAELTGLSGVSIDSDQLRYPVDPKDPNRHGNSFVVVSPDKGFAIYAHAGKADFKPKGTKRYIFQKGKGKSKGSQGVGVSIKVEKGEMKTRPFLGDSSKMEVEIGGLKMKTGNVGKNGKCRFNFTLSLKCASRKPACNPKRKAVSIMIRAGSISNEKDKREGYVSIGKMSNGEKNSLQYNIIAKSPKVEGRTGEIVARAKGVTLFEPSDKKENLVVTMRFDQFKAVLHSLADKYSQEDGGQSKMDAFFGQDWDDPEAWSVLSAGSRMEITQDGDNTTQCGGSFEKFAITAM